MISLEWAHSKDRMQFMSQCDHYAEAAPNLGHSVPSKELSLVLQTRLITKKLFVAYLVGTRRLSGWGISWRKYRKACGG